MYLLSIILILVVLRLRCSLVLSSTGYDFPAECQWALQGAFGNISQHIIARRLQTDVLIFLSLSHYIVVAVYEWFCIIHASYSLAVTVDLKMTQMQSVNGDSSHRGMKWEEKGNWSDLLTKSHLSATKNVNSWASFYP